MPNVLLRPRRLVSALVLLLALAGSASAQGLAWVREHYTKSEHYIPMRDGVRLFTAIYTPKDTSQRYPILLLRTPYSVSPYGADRYREDLGPSPTLARSGYIFVYQDVRGRWMSEGEFVQMRPHLTKKSGPKDIDESTDTYDTIEWLLKHVPNHNGRVGQYGISYPGFYTAAGMIDAHPALKAASPQAPVADWFGRDDWHHNGAFFLAHAFRWLASNDWPRPGPVTERPVPAFTPPTEDGYAFFLREGTLANLTRKYMRNAQFWHELMRRDTRDAFWEARDIRPHLRDIRPAVMTVGGWYDAENLFGALEVYKAVETQSPRATNVLVMGPWIHGGWARGAGDSLGDVRFDAATSEFYREHIEAPFFEYYLKDKGTLDLPEAWAFETGTNRWRRFDAWPPRNAQEHTFYFGPRGTLTTSVPTGTDDAFDEYVSDPDKPVPYIGGISFRMANHYMVDDQRFAARRPDVLVYQTDVLEEDLTMAGPITATLHVSTTGTDADWIVKLIDVYPDRYPSADGSTDNALGNYQQLVRGDVIRGRFRNGFDNPQPFTPGEPTTVTLPMDDVFHTFRKGHRLMVQVQSTWFPLVDRNPQTFTKISEAGPEAFQKATQRVYRGGARASGITVRVLR